MESKRQLQVARIVKEALSEVFIKEGPNYYGSAFVTIYDVKMTPDLFLARIYLSIYNTDKQDTLDLINTSRYSIKAALVKRLRNKLRMMPELEFSLDETLDQVFKMENVFQKLKDTSTEEE